jgi:HEAT repeat protein
METLIAELRALVGRLNNLHEIFRVQGEILSYGEEAVEPLAALLLSEPSGFPEPRVAAAECLGAIGSETAIAALIQILDRHDLESLGPVQRFAEEMVRNAAARRLGRFRQPLVVDALLSSLRRDHLIGAGEALAQLAETRAIPHLIKCLEDDYKKEKATEALRQFGHAAVPYLCEAVQRARSVAGVEPPVSRERRCRAAELLGDLKAQEAVPALEIGRDDENAEVRIASSVALARLGIARYEVLCQLFAGLEDPDLLVRKSCEEALHEAGAKALTLIAAAAAGEPIPTAPGAEICLSLNARLVAIKILGSIPHVAAVRCLVNQLKDPEEIVRYRTVAVLEKFKDPDVRAALEQVVRNDSSRRVKMRAWEGLQNSMKRNVAKAS